MSKMIEESMLRLRDRLIPSVPNYVEANRNGLAAAAGPGRKYLILGLLSQPSRTVQLYQAESDHSSDREQRK